MNYLYYKGKHYNVPGTWNELSRSQIIRVMEILGQGLPPATGRLKIFKVISGLSWWTIGRMTGFFKWKWLDLIIDEDWIPAFMLKYLNQTERLQQAIDECTAFILDLENVSLTKQLIPYYKGCYGPADDINNMRMHEFCHSEFFFVQYSQTSNITYLNKLVATLYRPARENYNHKQNPDGDSRIPFNPNTLEAHAAKVALWPLPLKIAIAVYYRGCRAKKEETYEPVFRGGDGDESLYGLWSVMRLVAKGGHFGDFDKVETHFVDTILMEMNESIAEAEKIRDPLPTHNQ